MTITMIRRATGMTTNMISIATCCPMERAWPQDRKTANLIVRTVTERSNAVKYAALRVARKYQTDKTATCSDCNFEWTGSDCEKLAKAHTLETNHITTLHIQMDVAVFHE